MAIENPPNAPWLAEARQFVGLKEIVGSRHEAKILQFFAEAGHPGIHDDETAWCAAFVGAMLRRAGYGSSGALNARSYLNFGTKLLEPVPGCIVVFKRGNSAWQGHVGFVHSVNADGSLNVLGGNQGNAVSIARFGKGDLLGYRWPLIKSAPASKPKPANTAGKVGGGAVAGGAVVVGTGAAIEAGWSYGEIAVLIFVLIALAVAGYFAWRWWQARQAAPAAEGWLEAAKASAVPEAPERLSKSEMATADDLANGIAAKAKARAAVAKSAEPERRRKPRKAATVKRRAAKSAKKRRA